MPLTRARRRENEREGRMVPYRVPTEVLGQIYRQVDRPNAFGSVNSAFRGVREDPHFERNRLRRMLDDEIRRNNGSKIFDTWPGFIELEYFFSEGCVLVHVEKDDTLLVYGRFKHVVFKAIVGVRSLSGAQFIPVGKFDIHRIRGEPEERHPSPIVVEAEEAWDWLTEKIRENNPSLKADLIRIIRADLQNLSRIPPPTRSSPLEWRTIFAQRLSSLPSFEQANITAADVVDAMLDLEIVPPVLRKENAKIVGDTLEVSLCFTLFHLGYF